MFLEWSLTEEAVVRSRGSPDGVVVVDSRQAQPCFFSSIPGVSTKRMDKLALFQWGFKDDKTLDSANVMPQPRRVDIGPEFLLSTCQSSRYGDCSVIHGDGRVYTYLDERRAQLGDGRVRAEPILLVALKDVFIVSVATNKGRFNPHSLFLSQIGNVYGAGVNGAWGGTGDVRSPEPVLSRFRVSIPMLIQLSAPVSSIHCGSSLSCCINNGKRTAITAGSGLYGQLGHGNTVQKAFAIYSAFRAVPSGSGEIISVAFGYGSGALVRREGKESTLWVWGNNSFGQLAKGTYDHHANSVPTAVVYFKQRNIHVESVDCGKFCVFVITASQEIYTWGKNEDSCCGVLSPSMSLPVKLTMRGVQSCRFLSLRCSFAPLSIALCEVDGQRTLVTWGKAEPSRPGIFLPTIVPEMESIRGEVVEFGAYSLLMDGYEKSVFWVVVDENQPHLHDLELQKEKLRLMDKILPK